MGIKEQMELIRASPSHKKLYFDQLVTPVALLTPNPALTVHSQPPLENNREGPGHVSLEYKLNEGVVLYSVHKSRVREYYCSEDCDRHSFLALRLSGEQVLISSRGENKTLSSLGNSLGKLLKHKDGTPISGRTSFFVNESRKLGLRENGRQPTCTEGELIMRIFVWAPGRRNPIRTAYCFETDPVFPAHWKADDQLRDVQPSIQHINCPPSTESEEVAHAPSPKRSCSATTIANSHSARGYVPAASSGVLKREAQHNSVRALTRTTIKTPAATEEFRGTSTTIASKTTHLPQKRPHQRQQPPSLYARPTEDSVTNQGEVRLVVSHCGRSTVPSAQCRPIKTEPPRIVTIDLKDGNIVHPHATQVIIINIPASSTLTQLYVKS
ncbi:hypothetical protein Pelo_15983 [Pelomyxa schiedti]|nr:hypothetical protein Pelo_15983 [Pelomyxa schiedti]